MQSSIDSNHTDLSVFCTESRIHMEYRLTPTNMEINVSQVSPLAVGKEFHLTKL